MNFPLHPYKKYFILLPYRRGNSRSASSLALVPSSNRYGSPQSTSWRFSILVSTSLLYPPLLGFNLLASTLLNGLWYHLQRLKLITSRYCPVWVFSFEFPLKIFKTCLLKRDFYTFIKKNVLFSSPHNVKCHILQHIWVQIS